MEIDQFTRAKIKVMNRVQRTVNTLDSVNTAMQDSLAKTLRNEERAKLKASIKEIRALHRFRLAVQSSKNFMDIHKASAILSKEVDEFAHFVESMNEDLFNIIQDEM